jgi:hypothetical protein
MLIREQLTYSRKSLVGLSRNRGPPVRNFHTSHHMYVSTVVFRFTTLSNIFNGALLTILLIRFVVD